MSTIRTTNVRNEASATNNLALDASGNVTIGNNLTVTGTTTQTGNATFTGSASVSGNATIGGATFSPSAPASGSIAMTGTLAMGSSFLRNRIINGDMRIDQRNAGAAVTTSASFPVDRFLIANTTDGAFSAQQSTSVVPTGFTNSLGVTITTADTSLTTTQQLSILQIIEGFNIADFGFGAPGALTITISFWARSSLTGTFGGALRNSAGNRSYPFSYSINSANTWEYKSVTVAGDTTGTWLTNNGAGITLSFGLGGGPDRSGTSGAWNGNNNTTATGAVSVVGTLNATFYITGVQLEAGSVATPFERRQYGTELMLCKRYYDKTFAINTAPAQNLGRGGALETLAVRSSGATVSSYFRFSVPMRITPTTFTTYNPSAANAQARNLDTASDCTSTGLDNINEIGGKVIYVLPAGAASTNLISVHWSADAEL